ncbi:hypothetical protein [Tritonibacter scottomollicae]|uniref:hypothetical protein n=1 Tax=Tritonibacter scottomollicae TaxID=483013 RepID=UPI003BAD9731
MINVDAALCHDLFEIAIRDAKPSVKVHRVQDHRFREMCTFEINQLSTSGRRSAKHILWTCPQPNAMAAPKVCDTTIKCPTKPTGI